MLLDRARCTIFVENAFRHARKHENHRIDAIVLRCVGVLKYTAKRFSSFNFWAINLASLYSPPTVVGELAIEELVHQYHLHDDVNQAEEFTEPIADCVQFMALKRDNHPPNKYQLRLIDGARLTFK